MSLIVPESARTQDFLSIRLSHFVSRLILLQDDVVATVPCQVKRKYTTPLEYYLMNSVLAIILTNFSRFMA